MPGVEEERVKFLLADVAKTWPHSSEDVGRPADGLFIGRVHGGDTAPEFEGGRQSSGRGRSDSLHAFQQGHVCGSQSMKAPKGRDDPTCDLDGRAMGTATSHDEGE